MEASEDAIDTLVTGLVREYLYRHGHLDVLSRFDSEVGFEPASATPTPQLVKSLRLSTLYRRNAAQPTPLPSVLDVLASYLYRHAPSRPAAAAPQQAQLPPPPPPPTAALPPPPATQPSQPDSGSFFARIAAQKAAEAQAKGASAAAPPPPAIQPPKAAAPVAAAATAGGGSFFERIAAAKAAQAAAEAAAAGAAATAVAAAAPTAQVVAAVPAAAAAATAPTLPAATATLAPPPPAAAAATTGGGSFFERLAAKKAAEAAAAAAGGAAAAAAPSALPSSVSAVVAALATPQAPPPPPPPPPAFVAPDGRGFSDRSEYRKYLFATFYSWSGLRGASLSKPPGSLAGQPFSVSDCSDSTLALCDWSETVQVDRCAGLRLFIAASCESVFLRNLSGCSVTVACKQLRVRDCRDCTFYLYAKTEPVIEASSGLSFAPYNGACAGLGAAFAAAALDPLHNHWDRVFDFSKDDTALPVPHWERQGEWGGGGGAAASCAPQCASLSHTHGTHTCTHTLYRPHNLRVSVQTLRCGSPG